MTTKNTQAPTAVLLSAHGALRSTRIEMAAARAERAEQQRLAKEAARARSARTTETIVAIAAREPGIRRRALVARTADGAGVSRPYARQAIASLLKWEVLRLGAGRRVYRGPALGR